MNRNECPKCKKLLVPPFGPRTAPILLIGEFAGYKESKEGIPMVGDVGDILTAELGKVGIQFSACRRMNIWQHGKDEKTCDFQWHVNEAAKEIPNHKYIFIMGSAATQALFGKNVADISGLKIVSKTFPGIVFYSCPSPAMLLHGPLGEFRLALGKFRKEMKK